MNSTQLTFVLLVGGPGAKGVSGEKLAEQLYPRAACIQCPAGRNRV